MKGRKFNSLSTENRLLREKAKAVCFEFNRTPSKGNLRNLKRLFAACGNQVIIEQGFKCDYGAPIKLGDRVFINSNCTVIDGGGVSIGNDCLIGPNVQLLTINHDLNPTKRLGKTQLCIRHSGRRQCLDWRCRSNITRSNNWLRLGSCRRIGGY